MECGPCFVEYLDFPHNLFVAMDYAAGDLRSGFCVCSMQIFVVCIVFQSALSWIHSILVKGGKEGFIV